MIIEPFAAPFWALGLETVDPACRPIASLNSGTDMVLYLVLFYPFYHALLLLSTDERSTLKTSYHKKSMDIKHIVCICI